jgi:hypothetical protein
VHSTSVDHRFATSLQGHRQLVTHHAVRNIVAYPSRPNQDLGAAPLNSTAKAEGIVERRDNRCMIDCLGRAITARRTQANRLRNSGNKEHYQSEYQNYDCQPRSASQLIFTQGKLSKILWKSSRNSSLKTKQNQESLLHPFLKGSSF